MGQVIFFLFSLKYCKPIYFRGQCGPRYKKTGLRGFRQDPTQTGLYSHRRRLEAGNFGFRKKRDCTIRVGKTKALISFAVTAKLICVFVFAYAKSLFSHDEAHVFLPFCEKVTYAKMNCQNLTI